MRLTCGSAFSLMAGCVLLGLANSTVEASFHLWKVDEVYSNASGSVQFIEFQQPNFEFDDERFLTSAGTLTDSVLGHTYNFTTNLPSTPTANAHFLVATPGYAALSGVPAADYVLPANNFFNPSGDTITFGAGVNSLTFSASQLPLDGLQSLDRAYGSTTLTKDTNSPTNFAGSTGTISVPEPNVLAIAAGSALFGLISRRRHAI